MPPKKSQFRAIDFFCGIGGITAGFRAAGVKVLGGIDIDASCKETYEKNNRGSKFFTADINTLAFDELKEHFGVRKRDRRMIFIACSPCQFWTKINTDKTKSEETKNLLSDFERFIEHFKPGYIVIENVPGIKKKSGSPLKKFLKFLRSNKYTFDEDIINASHYGVPQTRKRYLLIATRVKKSISLPEPSRKDIPTVRDFIGDNEKFPSVRAGHRDKTKFQHTTMSLSENNLRRLRKTKKNGGRRHAWKDDSSLQLAAYEDNDHNFIDNYGRMRWNAPAPTLTTKFPSISNGRFAHPTQTRGLSLREGATLQTFRTSYVFYHDSIAAIARSIGNAVPPLLAKRIAFSIIK